MRFIDDESGVSVVIAHINCGSKLVRARLSVQPTVKPVSLARLLSSPLLRIRISTAAAYRVSPPFTLGQNGSFATQ